MHRVTAAGVGAAHRRSRRDIGEDGMTTKAILQLLATSALATSALPALAQTQADPGQTAPAQPSDAPATSPTAPGQNGTDTSTTDVTRVATGDQTPDNANAPADQLQDVVVTAN